MVDLDAHLAVGAAYCAASRAGDADALLALGDEDSVVWHNADGKEGTLAQTAKSLSWLHRKVPDVGWDDVALTATAEGFVWRAVLTGSAPGGPLHAHTCVVVTLDAGGTVSRIDEYLDPSQLSPLTAGG